MKLVETGKSLDNGIKQFNDLLQKGVWHFLHIYFVKLSQAIQVILMIDMLFLPAVLLQFAFVFESTVFERSFRIAF